MSEDCPEPEKKKVKCIRPLIAFLRDAYKINAIDSIVVGRKLIVIEINDFPELRNENIKIVREYRKKKIDTDKIN